MKHPLRTLVFAFLPLALAACENTPRRLSEIAANAERLCASDGVAQAPASTIFDQEQRVCYGYRTVNDRPLHWTDIDTIRGEGRFGATFAAETARIAAGEVIIAFNDGSYECLPATSLVAARDISAEVLSDGATSCYWRIGRQAQVEEDLAQSRESLETRQNPPLPELQSPRPPRIIPLSP